MQILAKLKLLKEALKQLRFSPLNTKELNSGNICNVKEIWKDICNVKEFWKDTFSEQNHANTNISSNWAICTIILSIWTITVIPKEQNYSSWFLCDSFSIEANLASGNLRVSMGIAESFRVVVVREDDRLTLEFSRCIMFEMC